MRKGQGAFEYIMTYGWAIIIIIIVGIILYNSGVFGQATESTQGFIKIRPSEHAFYFDGSAVISWVNVAGQSLKSVTVGYTGDCVVNSSLGNIKTGKRANDEITCSSGCTIGDAVIVDASVSYIAETGVNRTETGVIRGTCFQKTLAFSLTWPFTNASNYTYNSSEAEVSGGTLSLLLQSFSIIDDTQDEFNNGTHNNTEYNTTGGYVQLSPVNTTGNFSSKIQAAGLNASWKNISWFQELCYGCDLPDSGATESGNYVSKVNMSANVLLMHMDEESGSTIADTSGNGNNGTYNGTNQNQTGKFDKGLGFNGENESLLVDDDASLQLTTAGSIELWVKPDSTTQDSDANLVSKTNGSTDADISYALYWDQTDSVIRGQISNGSDSNTVETSLLASTEFHHIVFTWNSSDLAMYVNGSSVNSTTANATAQANSTHTLRIGGATFNDSGDQEFNGTLDELAIYNSTLTSAQVLEHYKRGILKLNMTVRSCNDSACSGESLTDIADVSPVTLSVDNNTHFQYVALFDTDDATYSPLLYNVSIAYERYANTTVNVTTSNLKANSAIVAWTSFTETAAISTGSAVYYQLSNDSGTSWQEWSGAAWTTTGALTYNNTASTINTNIPTFTIDGKQLRIRLYLVSTGGQISVDEISAGYST